MKGLTPEQVESLGVTLILNNTYHLNLRPGIPTLEKASGAHSFQGTISHKLRIEDEVLKIQAGRETY